MSAAKELREQSVADLKDLLIGLRKEEFNLRLQKSARQLSNPARFGAIRREVARIYTILGERQREAQS